MEQAESSAEQAEAAEKDKGDADLEDAEEWFTRERLESFVTHLQRSPVLWKPPVHSHPCNKKSGRGFAYTRLIDALDEQKTVPEQQRLPRARALCKAFFRLLRQKLRWAAQESLTRGGAAQLARALLPAWARRADGYLRLLPNYFNKPPPAKKAKPTENTSTERDCDKYAATDTAAGRRLLRRIVRGMRRAAPEQRGLSKATAAAVADKLDDTEDHVFSLWCSMRSLAMAKFRTLLSRGDVPPVNPSARMSARDWAVADLLLMYDCALISDSNFQQYDQLRALLATFHLVQRFRLEPEPDQQERVPPQTWTAAARWYSRNRVVMSGVGLQKRWHELAQDARWRLRAHLRGGGALPVVLPLHQAVARRYPHIVTATTFEPWRKLVSSGKVAAPTSPSGPAPGDPVSARQPRDTDSSTDSDTANLEDDDDLIIVEKNIETIDLSEDEAVSERVRPRTIKRSRSDDMPIIDPDSGEDISKNDDDRISNSASVEHASKSDTKNQTVATKVTSGESNSAPADNPILSPKPKTVNRNWFKKTEVGNKDTGAEKSNTLPVKDESKNYANVPTSGTDETLSLNTKTDEKSKVTNIIKKIKNVLKNSFNKDIDFNKEIIDADASSPQADVVDALQGLDTCDVETMVLFDSEEDDTKCNLDNSVENLDKSKKSRRTEKENSRILNPINEQSKSGIIKSNKPNENDESHNSNNSQAQKRLERNSSDSSEGNLVIDHNDEIDFEDDRSSNSYNFTNANHDANEKTTLKERTSSSNKKNYTENCTNESYNDSTDQSKESEDSSNNKNTLLQQMLISDEVEQLNTLKVDVTKVAKVYENKKKCVTTGKRYNRETVSVTDLISAVRIQEHAKNIVREVEKIDISNSAEDMGGPDSSISIDVEQEEDMDTEDGEVVFDPKLLMVPIVPLKRIDDEIDLRTTLTSPSLSLSLHRSESSHGSVASRRSISPSGSISSRRSGTSRRSISPRGSVISRRSVSSRRSGTSRRSVISRRSTSSRHSISPRIPSPTPEQSQTSEQSFLEKNKELLKKCKPCSIILKRVEPGSYCGSERGSRVTKRVELPNIEEVRRNNRSMLTAQVAPLSQRHGFPDSGSSTEAASSEEEWTPDAEELPLVNTDSRSSMASGEVGAAAGDVDAAASDVDTSSTATASSTSERPLARERLPPTASNLQRLLDDLAGAPTGEKCDHNCVSAHSACAMCAARLLAAPPAGAREAQLQRRLLRHHSAQAMRERPKLPKRPKPTIRRRPRPPTPPRAPSPPPSPRRSLSPPDPERDAREWLRQKNIVAEKFGVKPRSLKRYVPASDSSPTPSTTTSSPACPGVPPPSGPAPSPPPPPSLLPAASALYGDPRPLRLEELAAGDATYRLVVKDASGATKVLPLTEENLMLHGQPVNPAPNIFNATAVADLNRKLGALVEEPPEPPEPPEGGFDPVITCVQSLAAAPVPAPQKYTTLTFKNQAAACSNTDSDFVQKYVIIPSQNKSQPCPRPPPERRPRIAPATQKQIESATIQVHMSPTARDPTLPRVVGVTGNVQPTPADRAGGLHLVVSQNAQRNTPAVPNQHVVVNGNILQSGGIVHTTDVPQTAKTNEGLLNRPLSNMLQVNSIQAGPSQANTFVITSMPSSVPNQFVIGTGQPNLVVNPMTNTMVLSPMVQSQNNLVFGAIQGQGQASPMLVRSVQSGPSLKVTPQQNPMIVSTVSVNTPAVTAVETTVPSNQNEVKSPEVEKPPEQPTQDKPKDKIHIVNLDSATPPVASHTWVRGRDPTRLSVLMVGHTCWVLLKQFLVVCEQEQPPDQGCVFAISPRVRLVLPREDADDVNKLPKLAPKPDESSKPEEGAKKPLWLRVKSFARIVAEPAEAEPAGAAGAPGAPGPPGAPGARADGEEASALVAPPRVYLNDRVYQKLSCDPLVYAKLVVGVADARAGRALLLRGAPLQLYCLHSCKLYALHAEPKDDVSRITLSGDEEVSAALVSMARQLYQLYQLPDTQNRGTKRPATESRKFATLETVVDDADTAQDTTPQEDSADPPTAKPAYKKLRLADMLSGNKWSSAFRPRVLNHVVANNKPDQTAPQNTYHLLLPSSASAPAPARAPAPALAPASAPAPAAHKPGPACSKPAPPPAPAAKRVVISYVNAPKLRQIAPAPAPAKVSVSAPAPASADGDVIDILSSDEE